MSLYKTLFQDRGWSYFILIDVGGSLRIATDDMSHAGAYRAYLKRGEPEGNVLGGGKLALNERKRTIRIEGYSMTYGQEDRSRTREVLAALIAGSPYADYAIIAEE